MLGLFLGGLFLEFLCLFALLFHDGAAIGKQLGGLFAQLLSIGSQGEEAGKQRGKLGHFFGCRVGVLIGTTVGGKPFLAGGHVCQKIQLPALNFRQLYNIDLESAGGQFLSGGVVGFALDIVQILGTAGKG